MSSFAAGARVGGSFLRRRLVAWCILTALVACFPASAAARLRAAEALHTD